MQGNSQCIAYAADTSWGEQNALNNLYYSELKIQKLQIFLIKRLHLDVNIKILVHRNIQQIFFLKECEIEKAALWKQF